MNRLSDAGSTPARSTVNVVALQKDRNDTSFPMLFVDLLFSVY